MKKRIIHFLILGLGLFFISCTKIENFTEIDTPRYSGEYAPVLNDTPEELEIVNFNIKFAQKIDEAIEELESSENLKNADMIFLQEMDEVGTEAIAKALSYNYVYYPASRNLDGQLFGLSILSKWPIVDDEKILLPHDTPFNDRKRIAVTAEVMFGNKAIRVYNIHTSTFTVPKANRREQFRTIVTHLNKLEETGDLDNVLIAGDFNTDKSADIDYLVELYEAEGFEWVSEEIGPTYQILSGLSKLTLDHVFTRGFDLVKAGKNKKTKASDHLPIWITLKL